MKYYYKYCILLIVLLLIYLFYLFYVNRNNADLKILYEDDYIIVIVKPPHVASHKSPGWTGPTVVQTLINNGHALYNDKTSYQDGIVHRLDAGTSGIMVLAKNKLAYDNLKDQFKYRTVIKKYNALIEGTIEPTFGTINEPIGVANQEENYKYEVDPNGKYSVSNYKTLRVFPGSNLFPTVSLIEVHLDTGRTHQIRAHFSYMKHPLVGDSEYGADVSLANRLGINHQWLNAKLLEFNHPLTNKRLIFNSDPPNALKNALSIISNNSSTAFNI